ncbi:unnamed protein product [Darwinula stevensoni]|uniref:Uncharacterized protein n=1 Tax=Darwinula stevensoni TaxID=69355 RepID=A0A7R9ADJ7_9CRUS|nr:unnamed protein product [Darwinula stevensoni]CAG0901376.1 unnamed protein product [Darwinula stevensoni]
MGAAHLTPARKRESYKSAQTNEASTVTMQTSPSPIPLTSTESTEASTVTMQTSPNSITLTSTAPTEASTVTMKTSPSPIPLTSTESTEASTVTIQTSPNSITLTPIPLTSTVSTEASTVTMQTSPSPIPLTSTAPTEASTVTMQTSPGPIPLTSTVSTEASTVTMQTSPSPVTLTSTETTKSSTETTEASSSPSPVTSTPTTPNSSESWTVSLSTETNTTTATTTEQGGPCTPNDNPHATGCAPALKEICVSKCGSFKCVCPPGFARTELKAPCEEIVAHSSNFTLTGNFEENQFNEFDPDCEDQGIEIQDMTAFMKSVAPLLNVHQGVDKNIPLPPCGFGTKWTFHRVEIYLGGGECPGGFPPGGTSTWFQIHFWRYLEG